MKTNVSTLFGTLLVCAVCAVQAEQAPQIESLQLEAKEIGATAQDKIVSSAHSAKEALTPSESTTSYWKDTMQTMQDKAANAARSAQEMAKSTQQLAMDNKLATVGILGTTAAIGGGAAYYIKDSKAKKVQAAKDEAEQAFRDAKADKAFRDAEVKDMLKQARKVGAGKTTLKQSTFQEIPPKINDLFTDPMNIYGKSYGQDAAWKERLSNKISNPRAEEQYKTQRLNRFNAKEQYKADKARGLVHKPTTTEEAQRKAMAKANFTLRARRAQATKYASRKWYNQDGLNRRALDETTA